MEVTFFRLLVADGSAVLYRPQWRGSAKMTYLTDHLDTIIATHDSKNIVILSDLN